MQGSRSQIQIQLLPTRTSVLQITLRASPIITLPSHSSAPSDARQTPASKFCCSFHLFEAWQPVDPKTHRPHSGIFTLSRVTRPRIWPLGVKGLAILGLTRPQPQLHALQMQQRTMPYPSYISGVGCIHAGLPQGLYAHPSPGIRSRLPLSLTSFVCFELPLSFQFVRSLSTTTAYITASNLATLFVNAHDRFLHCLNDKVLASRNGSTFDASEARPHMPCIKHCAIFLSPQCRRLRSTGFGRITAA